VKLDQRLFQKKDFTKNDLDKLLANSSRDLHIAKKSRIPEVIFKFSYDAFLKACITIIAFQGYRAMSKRGHHKAIISATKKILGKQFRDMVDYCDTMRRRRNIDLYGGGVLVSLSESKQFLRVVSRVHAEIKKRVSSKL